MIIVSGEIQIDPASEEAFLAEVANLVPATLAEPGCSAYSFWKHTNQPGAFHVFEEWATDEALGAHLATAHYRSFGRAMRGFGVVKVDVQRYDATGKQRLGG